MLLADQRIVTFIQDALAKGNSRADIERVLTQKGWKTDQIKEAFGVASSVGSSSIQNATKPLATKRTLFIVLGALLLLLLLGIAYTFIPSDDSECSSDSDCSRGYSCDDGECIKEEVEIEEEFEEVVVEEEVECVVDDDCLGGFACSSTGSCYDSCTATSGCADRFSCDAGDCVAEVDEEASDALEDYTVLGIRLADLRSPQNDIDFAVEYVNLGEASSTQKIALACFLSLQDGTVLNSSVAYVSALDVNESSLEDLDLDLLEENITAFAETISGSSDEFCSLASVDLLTKLESVTSVNISVNATINYYWNVSEAGVYENSLVETFNVSLFNTTMLGSTACSDSSSCTTGYDCSLVDYCYRKCSEYGSECVEEYTCEDEVCVEESEEIAEDEEASPEDLAACADGEDNDGDGYYDYEGACTLNDGSILSCSDELFSGLGEGDTCEGYCDSQQLGYLDPDTDCTSADADSEDGSASTSDVTCVSTVPSCADGEDNDGDGLTDIQDDGCSSWEGEEVAEEEVETEDFAACEDGEDNDSDGYTDYYGACEDSTGTFVSCSDLLLDIYSTSYEDYSVRADILLACYAACEGTSTIEGIGGSYTAYDDSCESADGTSEEGEEEEEETEEGTPECSDGIDNDDDGDVDYSNDGGCISVYDLTEKYDCRDGLDNDDDGLTDYSGGDTGCGGQYDVSEYPACNDGIDNDEQGDYDFLGACYYSTVLGDFVETCEELGASREEDCEAECDLRESESYGVYSTEYKSADSNCVDANDNYEKEGDYYAPGEEKSFLKKLYTFFFQSESVDDAFLEKSFAGK